MQEQKSLIWDFDGTLVDSYGLIVDSIYDLMCRYSVIYSKDEIFNFVKRVSVNDFFEKISNEVGINSAELKSMYTKIRVERLDEYTLIPHAKDVLEYLSRKNTRNFVYTHSSKAAIKVLENLDILEYFEEVITKENGFLRKPSKDAIDYLVEKYKLNKNNTYYVGDRSLDVECARNAGVLSILLSNDLPYIKETHRVNDLIEIKELF